MGNFFAELRRRHIYRIGAGYVVVAWGVAQLIDFLSQVWALPAWIAQPVSLVLAIGLPVTLVVAWLIEGEAHKGETGPVSPATKLDWLIAGGLAAVLLVIGYQQFASVPSQQTGLDAAQMAANDPDTAVSIAVLPFANISGDPTQQFFSDGMTEEISFALAKVPDLRVVARTSAFEFREQDRDFQSIGQALNATHFIDGSVRQDGERVRITARLIEANDSTQVWAENYDRELTDVFAIQEEIATAIASALNMQLGLAPGEQLLSNRSISPQSYEQYLRARSSFVEASFHEAVPLLEFVVARDPGYAPAWALLSIARARSLIGNQFTDLATLDDAGTAATEAMRLDPNSPKSIGAQAFFEFRNGRRAIADDLFRKALALDPTEPDILDRFTNFLFSVGKVEEVVEIREQLETLEPLVNNFKIYSASYKLNLGPDEEAIATLEATDSENEIPHQVRVTSLAAAYAELGRYEDAANVLLTMRCDNMDSVRRAARHLRSAPVRISPDEATFGTDCLLGFVYAFVGEPNRVMDWYDLLLIEAELAIGFRYWSPGFAEVRKTERFKTFIHDIGVYDYWREHGFADICRPVGEDDFECD
jgi:TolB-like protein